MKLFKCRAVMPRHAHEDTHPVQTYVVVATTWEEARARVQAERPDAEFVTIPIETPDVLMVAQDSMSAREAADLHSACNWRERHSLRHAEAVPVAGPEPEPEG
jgi:hypothetical protein